MGPEDYVCSTCRPEEGELIPNRPTQPPSCFISLPTDPDYKDTIGPHLPAQFIASEPSQEPIKPECTSLPAEPQCSPSPQQNPTDPLVHPAPCQAESTEVQHSSAVPTDLTQHPAQPQSESEDIRSLQAPPHQEALVLASPGNMRELHRTPPSSHCGPSEQLDCSATPQPYSSEHNLAASHQDPVEPQLTSPSESPHCPAASHRDPEEPHHCPPPSQQDQATPRCDSEPPPQPESKEPRQSPATPEEDLPQFHHSPSPHPESQSPRNYHVPFHQDPAEPDKNHAPSRAELAEKCLEPPDQDPAHLHQDPESMERTPAAPQPERSVLLCSPASLCFTTTEVQISPLETHAQLHPHGPEPRELVGDLAQLPSDPTAFQTSPAPALAENLGSPQDLSSHAEPAKLHLTAVSSHANTEERTDPTNQGNHLGTNSSPTEQPEAPSLSPDQTAIQKSPARIHQSSASLNQHSSDQHSHNTAASATSSSTEDQCAGPTFPHSPEREGFLLCSDALSPSQIQLQPGSSHTQQTPQTDTPRQQSLPLHRPVQDCEPDLAPHPAGDPEPTPTQERPESPSQVWLDRTGGHTVLKVDRDGSPLCCRSTRTVRKQACPKSCSAPCSPSPSQPPMERSVSQPSSPVHSQAKLGSSQSFRCNNKSSGEVLSGDCLGLADKRQTMETLDSLRPDSNVSPKPTGDTDDKPSEGLTPATGGRLNTDHLSLASVPPKHTLESLSPRPGEDIVPLPPQRPSDGFLRCTEPNDIVQKGSVSYSPQHTDQMPTVSAASLPACPVTGEPSPATDESSYQPSNLLESPVRSPGLPDSSRAVTPPPTYLNLFQSNTNGGEAHHPRPSIEPETGRLCSSTDSLDHDSIVHKAATINDGLRDSARDGEKVLFTVCGTAEVTQTNVSPTRCAPVNVPNPDGPSQSTTVTSRSPLASSHALGQDEPATFSSAKVTETPQSHFPDRSPVNVDRPSASSPSGASASTAHSGLAQTTADYVSSPHRLAQSNEIYCSPHHDPVRNTENSPGPGSTLNADVDVSSEMPNSFLPSLVNFEPGPDKPDDVREMMPEPVSSSLCNKSPDAARHALNTCFTESHPSAGSPSPLPLTTVGSVDMGSGVGSPSPHSPVCCSPSQVSRSMHSCSHGAGAPVSPQALSPHRETSSPATAPKGDPLEPRGIKVHPGPVSGHSEDTPSPGPDSPLPCFHATLTSVPQNIRTQRESVAAEGKYQENQKRSC